MLQINKVDPHCHQYLTKIPSKAVKTPHKMSRKYDNSYFIEFVIRHHDFCQTITEGISKNIRPIKTKNNSYRFVILFSAYKNCAEVYQSGDKISGVYKINPDGLGEFEVFCDQKTAGGGWTVFQKRRDMTLLISFALGMITNAVLVI